MAHPLRSKGEQVEITPLEILQHDLGGSLALMDPHVLAFPPLSPLTAQHYSKQRNHYRKLDIQRAG